MKSVLLEAHDGQKIIPEVLEVTNVYVAIANVAEHAVKQPGVVADRVVGKIPYAIFG